MGTDQDSCIIACSNVRPAACVTWTGGSDPCRCVWSGTNPVENGRYSSYRLWQHDRYDCRMSDLPPWMNWFEENPVIYVLLGATWLTIALCWCYYTNRCVRSRGKSVATWEPVAATECEEEVLVE